jgi:hypothetical protein
MSARASPLRAPLSGEDRPNLALDPRFWCAMSLNMPNNVEVRRRAGKRNALGHRARSSLRNIAREEIAAACEAFTAASDKRTADGEELTDASDKLVHSDPAFKRHPYDSQIQDLFSKSMGTHLIPMAIYSPDKLAKSTRTARNAKEEGPRSSVQWTWTAGAAYEAFHPIFRIIRSAVAAETPPLWAQQLIADPDKALHCLGVYVKACILLRGDSPKAQKLMRKIAVLDDEPMAATWAKNAKPKTTVAAVRQKIQESAGIKIDERAADRFARRLLRTVRRTSTAGP